MRAQNGPTKYPKSISFVFTFADVIFVRNNGFSKKLSFLIFLISSLFFFTESLSFFYLKNEIQRNMHDFQRDTVLSLSVLYKKQGEKYTFYTKLITNRSFYGCKPSIRKNRTKQFVMSCLILYYFSETS